MINFEEEGLGEGDLGLPPESQEASTEKPVDGDLPLSETPETDVTSEGGNTNSVEGLESQKGTESESEGSEKPDPQLTVLQEQYEKAQGLEDQIEDFRKTEANIAELYLKLHMENKLEGGAFEASVGDKLERIKKLIAETEKRYLELPKGPAEGEEEHQSLDATGELEQAFEDKKAELDEMEKTAEAEAKKMREEFVEKYIKDSTKFVFEQMDEAPEMSDIVNMKKGKKLATLKITSTVHSFAERFIEEGGFPDFGYRVRWNYCWYDMGKGEGQKKYITEFNVERNYWAEAKG